MGRGSGRLAAFLLTLAILCVVRVDGDFHPPRVTLRKDLPQIIPVSDVDRIVLDDYKLCGDAYVIKSLYYCHINVNGLPRRKKCENLCGDPKDDARCTEKCPIYKQCVLGLSGENETMCLRFFEFKTHAEVMNPPTTESPTPELVNTTVEVAKKTVKAKELICPVCINCDARQVDCSKCPGPAKEDITADLRYDRLLELNRELLKEVRKLKTQLIGGEQVLVDRLATSVLGNSILAILALFFVIVIGVLFSQRKPGRAYNGGTPSESTSQDNLLDDIHTQHRGGNELQDIRGC